MKLSLIKHEAPSLALRIRFLVPCCKRMRRCIVGLMLELPLKVS